MWQIKNVFISTCERLSGSSAACSLTQATTAWEWWSAPRAMSSTFIRWRPRRWPWGWHQDEDFNAYSSKPSATKSLYECASIGSTENICQKRILNTMTQLVFRIAILKKYLFFKVYFRRTSGRSQQSGILCANEPSLRLSSPPPTSAGSWWLKPPLEYRV